MFVLQPQNSVTLPLRLLKVDNVLHYCGCSQQPGHIFENHLKSLLISVAIFKQKTVEISRCDRELFSMSLIDNYAYSNNECN